MLVCLWISNFNSLRTSLPCFFSTARTQSGLRPTGAPVHSYHGVERGEATACFFCSRVTVGVTFPSQALSAKRRYLPARRFTHLARILLSGRRPSGGEQEVGERAREEGSHEESVLTGGLYAPQHLQQRSQLKELIYISSFWGGLEANQLNATACTLK